MPYVLLDDSSLSDIANAIRSRNKLVRTYKPREMAPAIRALKDLIPQSDGYEVRIAEYEHQKIKVRRYLNEEKTYTESFSSTKPFWKIQAEIEADPGYTPGTLNYPDELSVDRNIQISATPAEEVVVPPDIEQTLYWYGVVQDNWYDSRTSGIIEDRDVIPSYSRRYTTNGDTTFRPEGKVIYHIFPHREQLANFLFRFFNVHMHAGRLAGDRSVTDLVVDFQGERGLVTLQDVIGESPWLEYIQFNNWDTSEVESIFSFVKNCSRLKSIGSISNWDTSSLQSIDTILQGNQYLDSLDLSGWETPRLSSATNIFPSGRILDISNWDTTNIGNFSAGISAKTKAGVLYPAYLIMDKEEVKFSGNYIFGNIANCKYLVPPTVLDDYKQHPNWQSRASQIDDITKYTINRGGGQISITPNI